MELNMKKLAIRMLAAVMALSINGVVWSEEVEKSPA
jgi:hypothetical protein